MADPKPGVCGRCGQAVVQPVKRDKHTGWFKPFYGLPRPKQEGMFTHDVYIPEVTHGHRYENDKLVKVRCSPCAVLDGHHVPSAMDFGTGW